jgi:hypothetical protein
MPLSRHDDLFRDSGAKGMLDYLGSRLRAGDLSREEALAMLGALHEELAKGGSSDPGAYESYARLMRALQRAMPEVHDYVISTWGRRGTRPSPLGDPDDGQLIQDTAAGPAQPKTSGVDGVRGFDVPARAADLTLGADAEEPPIPEVEEEAEQEKEGEAEGEEAEVEENEAAGEEARPEAEKEEVEDRQEPRQEKEEPDSEAAEAEEEEVQETEQGAAREGEAPESVTEESAEAEQESPEPGRGEGASEPEPAGGEQAETEWPQFEEPGPEEPIEGEEGGMAGVD